MKSKKPLKYAGVIFFFMLLFGMNSLADGQTYMNINQTISDGAQKNTIAFDGLAFMTGDFCSCTFLPPGKVADYCGFQYLRDNDVTGLGHNTDFLTIIAFNMLHLLDSNQINALVILANNQVGDINQYGYLRFPLIEAFMRLYNNNIPAGTTSLNKDSVKEYSAKLYLLDGKIAYDRAKVYGQVLRSLNVQQKAKLDSLTMISGAANWITNIPDPLSSLHLSHDIKVAVMTYGSEMYSWYAGDIAADTYFCPERQCTYYGSFYMKDIPAMGNPGYSIDTNLTQHGGDLFLNTLTTAQKLKITSLVDTNRNDLYSVVSKRTQIATILRGFMVNNSVDSANVMNLSMDYGRLDGEMSYHLAVAFAEVGQTLTQVQLDTLMNIRNLDNYPCNGAYLYSSNIPSPSIINTDFFFYTPTYQQLVNNSGLQKLDSNYLFTEGPYWSDEGHLLFSDINGNKIYKWKPGQGSTVFVNASGRANGISGDIAGNIFTAQHSRKVSRIDTSGNITPIATLFNGDSLNSPNDIVVKSNGYIYFTDPTYGISPAQQELPFSGVFCIKQPGNSLVLLIDSLAKPNGIAFSPDEQILYIGNSYNNKIYYYEMKPDGMLKPGKLFTALKSEIDGIKTDLEGNVYVANALNGIKIFSPLGILIDSIIVPEKTRNLTWGDKYRNTLYITAGNSIYSYHRNPNYPFVRTELLSRPSNTSVTLNMIAEEDLQVYMEYGTSQGTYTNQSAITYVNANSQILLTINGLSANTQYYYRIRYKRPNEINYSARQEYHFHTQRSQSVPFTFDVHADPHLDESSNYLTYTKAMENTLNDNPDFMIDLGDNMMSEKYNLNNYEAIEKRALLMRYFYAKACNSVPLYIALGNHEGELGWLLNGTSQNLPVWAAQVRKQYFPNPEPNGFYSGDTTNYSYVGKRNSYYAWTWGDALFVVLDPYWNTVNNPSQSHDPWEFTLGDKQYLWFKSTLENSDAKFKFVFSHQIIGGDQQGRGGVEFAKYYEMGGYNLDSTWGFNSHRPGWEKPLHQLMADNGVNIFFHGHDHMYVKQTAESTLPPSCNIEGLIYQLVPQPSFPGYTNSSSVAAYNYTHGDIISNAGHLRIKVSDTLATVDYVRAYHKNNASLNQINGMVSASYSVKSKSNNYTMVSITANPSDTVNDGAIITFTATPKNGGSSPSFQWKVNGLNAGYNSDTFNYAPMHGDKVYCLMTSSQTCVAGNPDKSNEISITVCADYQFIETHSITNCEFYLWHGQNLNATGTYYANYKTSKGCDSTYVLNLNVINSTKKLTTKLFLEGLFNGNGMMKPAMNDKGPQFDPGIVDIATVELHDASPPNSLVSSFENIGISFNGTMEIKTIPCEMVGSYYLVIKHRNSIETWSSVPIEFGIDTAISYDLSYNASQAYGNNLKSSGSTYLLWGADISQDGIVDGTDMARADNASSAILKGYVPEDINGDGIVDGSDMAVIDNNSTAMIQAKRP